MTPTIDSAVIDPTPGDRHQPPDLLAVERVSGQRPFGALDLGVQRVMQPQRRVDLIALVLDKLDGREQPATLLAEHIGHVELDQVAREHRVDLVAQPRAPPDQARAVRDPPAQRARLLIRCPHLRQEVRGADCASTRASTLSVLTFADAIALVRIGFDTVTLPACCANSSTIAHASDVDSNTT